MRFATSHLFYGVWIAAAAGKRRLHFRCVASKPRLPAGGREAVVVAIRGIGRVLLLEEAEQGLDVSPRMHETFGETQFAPAMPQPSLRDGTWEVAFSFRGLKATATGI